MGKDRKKTITLTLTITFFEYKIHKIFYHSHSDKLMEHKDTKTRSNKDLTKTGGKPLFCKASVLARLCQKHSIVILQASLRLPMNSFQQPWRAWLYRKEKTVKNLCGDVYSLHITHRRSLLATSVGDRQGADNRRLFRWR